MGKDKNYAPQSWQIIASQDLLNIPPWVTVSVQRVRLPNGRTVDDYHQIKLQDYTLIFAQTSAGEVIVERAYKHGPRQYTLSLPAGLMEEGETPLASAQRELLEETGYVSDDWHSLAGCGRMGC